MRVRDELIAIRGDNAVGKSEYEKTLSMSVVEMHRYL